MKLFSPLLISLTIGASFSNFNYSSFQNKVENFKLENNSITEYRTKKLESKKNFYITELFLDEWILNFLSDSVYIGQIEFFDHVDDLLKLTVKGYYEENNEVLKRKLCEVILFDGIKYANQSVPGLYIAIKYEKINENIKFGDIYVGVFETIKRQPNGQVLDNIQGYNDKFDLTNTFWYKNEIEEQTFIKEIIERYGKFPECLEYSFDYISLPDITQKITYGDNTFTNELDFSNDLNGSNLNLNNLIYIDDLNEIVISQTKTIYDRDYNLEFEFVNNIILEIVPDLNNLWNWDLNIRSYFNVYNLKSTKMDEGFLEIDIEYNDKIAFFNMYDGKNKNIKSAGNSLPPKGKQENNRLYRYFDGTNFSFDLYLNYNFLSIFYEQILINEERNNLAIFFALQKDILLLFYIDDAYINWYIQFIWLAIWNYYNDPNQNLGINFKDFFNDYSPLKTEYDGIHIRVEGRVNKVYRTEMNNWKSW